MQYWEGNHRPHIIQPIEWMKMKLKIYLTRIRHGRLNDDERCARKVAHSTMPNALPTTTLLTNLCGACERTSEMR